MTLKSNSQALNISLDSGAFPLSKAHSADAGYDIKTPISLSVQPRSSAVVNTGVHVQIPHGYAGVLISKSGLNINHDITSTGLIDEGYTGPIIVKLYNHSDKVHSFYASDKITQLVLIPVAHLDVNVVDKLEETERGENGLGSSGR